MKCVGSPQSWYMWLSEWREKTKYVTHVDGYRLRCSWWYKGLRLVHLSLKGVCGCRVCVSLVSNVHQKSFNTTPIAEKTAKLWHSSSPSLRLCVRRLLKIRILPVFFSTIKYHDVNFQYVFSLVLNYPPRFLHSSCQIENTTYFPCRAPITMESVNIRV